MKKNIFGPYALRHALCALLSAEAQQPTKVPADRIPTAGAASVNPAPLEAFRQGLRELGYVEGKNIVIEYRYAEGKLDRLPALAVELVRLNVDIIVTGGQLQRPREGSNSDDPYRHGAGW